jgi:hypothetical protein
MKQARELISGRPCFVARVDLGAAVETNQRMLVPSWKKRSRIGISRPGPRHRRGDRVLVNV